jgi:hypothetical protein
VGVASATCLTGFDLRANTPVLVPLVGAATAQSLVDATGQNRVRLRDGLVASQAPGLVLASLAQLDFSTHQRRQYGYADTLGRTLTFSGTQNGRWAGGRTGRVGDLAYAIQGNVLTGPCVVDAAVVAVETTPGDLPTKLMAAMEAARAAGGDGRCSCSPDTADGCGCPVAVGGGVKSSHIAYLMVARAGDTEGCVGLYRPIGTPQAVAVGDLNGDGRPDLVLPTLSSTMLVMPNLAPTGAAAPAFAPPAVVNLPASSRAALIADFTGDGVNDVLLSSQGRVTVLPGRNDPALLRFGTRVETILPSQPLQFSTGDFNGDGLADVAYVPSNGQPAVLRGVGGGAFAPPVPLTGPDGLVPSSVLAGEFTGDGRADAAVVYGSSGVVCVFSNNGDGTFTREPNVTLGGAASGAAAGDFDGDGLTDLATSRSSPGTVRVSLRRAGGFVTQSVAVPGAPTRLFAGDVTGDGRVDVAALLGTAVRVLVNGDGGVFSLGQSVTLPTGFGSFLDVVGGNLSGDGTADLATFGSSLIVTLPAPRGTLVTPGGCANGDYFLNFNVAFTQAGDPDPVLTLRQRFDAARSALVGRPDAVASTAMLDRACVVAGVPTPITLRVVPSDHLGTPLTGPMTVTVTRADGPAVPTEVGDAVRAPVGSFVIPLTVGGPGVFAAGEVLFTVTVSDGGRPVVLMPPPRVRVAPGADVDGDGQTTPDDMADFIAAFFAHPGGTPPPPPPLPPSPPGPNIDFNASGRVDPDDLADFIAAFFAPCG